MATPRRYGEATTIVFPLIDAGAQDFETTPVTHAAGDTKIIKDEGASANTTNAFAHEGEGIYSLALTATEMQAARIVIAIRDSATKAWEDTAVIIETYGHPSAQHPEMGVALDMGVAQAGAAGTITLATGESASNDFYNGSVVYIVSGTGAGQSRAITDYVGTTKVASVSPDWVTNPTSSSVYVVLPAPPAEEIPEPASMFAWPATLEEILGWVGALARNEINQTNTTTTVRNAADTADIDTFTVGDDGTTFSSTP